MKANTIFIYFISSLLSLSMLHDCGSSKMIGTPAKQDFGSNSGSDSSGKTCSTARFTVLNDRLYTLTSGRIVSFSISKPWSPVQSGTARVEMDIETLYNDGKKPVYRC